MDTFPINLLDLISLIIIILSAIVSSLKGFVRESLSIFAWIGAIFCSIYLSPYFFNISLSFITNNILAEIITYILTFVIVLTTLSMVTRSLSIYIRSTALNNLDKSLGFIFGLIKGLIFLSITLIIFDWFSIEKKRPTLITSAKILPAVDMTSQLLINTLPDKFLSRYNIDKKDNKTNFKTNDFQEKINKLTKPEVPDNIIENENGGYNQGNRRSMDRLFQTNQN